ncbi:DNA-binding response regulator [Actinomadura spongiicola]|uniref:DNA-binding response regulator n=1 Tax=Actinomadura spongiicola TaxID=2303421 RepID=A0A372GMF6_9ACTN|nr:response regulator transcription factor [Actinomadura spongiicola]RFS86525.1 DNA-binding response regulator [Actinomadura spongiicola]
MKMVICDDHAVFAESLSLVLTDAGHNVVGVACSPADAMPLLRGGQPDLCLIDLRFPDGTALDWMARLRAASPGTRFIVLTGFLEPGVMESGLAAGVRGFAHKGQQTGDILAVLSRVADGEIVVDQDARRGGTRPNNEAQRAARFLTPREREVLTRLARGESTQALAKAMGVTRSTARSHVQSVLSKLGVHSQREAVIEAARHGLVSVETGEWLAG